MEAVPESGGLRNGGDWERVLARHYLRSDGPYGDAPLRFLDATSEELARAVGRPIADAEGVLADFLRSFSTQSYVLDVLDDRSSPRFSDDDIAPGYFRYLVLTCVVAATGAEVETEYRGRMQSLLSWSSPVGNLRGIHPLWEKLVGWCAAKRGRGDAYRTVVLPDRRHMVQIGESVLIAFPSWRDRLRLTSIVEDYGWEEFGSPRATVRRVRGRIESFTWSQAFIASFLDFETRYRRGERLLAEHAFWQLVQRVVGSIRRPEGMDEAPNVELRLVDHSWDDPDLLVSSDREIAALSLGGDRQTGFSRIYGPSTFAAAVPSTPGAGDDGLDGIRTALGRGVLGFVETAWGKWTFDPAPRWGPVRLLVSKRAFERAGSPSAWKSAGENWSISPPVDLGMWARATGEAHRGDPQVDSLRSLVAVGGVRTGPCFLGLPAFMPSIASRASTDLALLQIRQELGAVALGGRRGDLVGLVAAGPVSGTWRVVAREGSTRSAGAEMRLPFVDVAFVHPPRSADAEPSGSWVGQTEVATVEADDLGSSGSLVQTVPSAAGWSDLLEAVYAGGGSGWNEADLVPLIQRVLPAGGPSVWDVLRSLAEGGFVEARLAVCWGSRRWVLRPTRVLEVGAGRAILDGAWCRVAATRLEEVCRQHDVRFERRLGPSQWSVPVVVLEGTSLRQVADASGIRLVRAQAAAPGQAPGCWPASPLGTQQRLRSSAWSWDKRRFIKAPPEDDGQVRLERWVRANGDARPVYRVVDRRGGERIFENRTAAILETHRLEETPLFAHRDDLLVRVGGGGHLPIETVEQLRLRHAAAPGPVGTGDGGWTYAYPCDRNDVLRYAAAFGAAISTPPTLGETTRLSLHRHLGARGRALFNPATSLSFDSIR